jgi:hypothetical protein
MANKLLKKLEKNGESNIRLFVVGGVLLFALSIGLWINNIYLNPTNVFWGSFSNNISTIGFTKTTKTNSSGASLKQVVQIGLGGSSYSHSLTYLTRSGTTVVTEENNSPTYEYVRYLKISANPKNAGGKTANYSKVLNIWGYQAIPKGSLSKTTQTFYQSLFGILPFGNLTSSQRNSLLSFAKSHKVYVVNKSKSETINGQKVDSLTVSVNLSGYIEMMQKFGGYINYEGLAGINPSQYSKRPPVKITVSINPISRNLVRINNGSPSGITDYSGFGIDPAFKAPTKYISLQQLQTKIQAIK